MLLIIRSSWRFFFFVSLGSPLPFFVSPFAPPPFPRRGTGPGRRETYIAKPCITFLERKLVTLGAGECAPLWRWSRPAHAERERERESASYRLEKKTHPENRNNKKRKSNVLPIFLQFSSVCQFFSYFLDVWVFLFCSWPTWKKKKIIYIYIYTYIRTYVQRERAMSLSGGQLSATCGNPCMRWAPRPYCL